jgi:hypothetical protein
MSQRTNRNHVVMIGHTKNGRIRSVERARPRTSSGPSLLPDLSWRGWLNLSGVTWKIAGPSVAANCCDSSGSYRACAGSGRAPGLRELWALREREQQLRDEASWEVNPLMSLSPSSGRGLCRLGLGSGTYIPGPFKATVWLALCQFLEAVFRCRRPVLTTSLHITRRSSLAQDSHFCGWLLPDESKWDAALCHVPFCFAKQLFSG